LATGYGTYGSTTALWSKKKKAPAASKKVQVKMLKYVAGTGSIGDVVAVTPAFFQNKLQPTKSAVPITDEEVELEQAKQRAKEEATNAAASKMKEQLSDFTLELKRKAGPEGHLFGAVGPKVIIEELRNIINDPYLDQKQVKVISVTEDGTPLKHDIKHIGEFGVNLGLTKDITAKFNISVQEES
jgi:large subunit ribosomal protein L9